MAISSVKKTAFTNQTQPRKAAKLWEGPKHKLFGRNSQSLKADLPQIWNEQKPIRSPVVDSLYIRPTYYLLGRDFAAHDIVDAIGD